MSAALDELCGHCGGSGFDGDEPCEFCDASGRDPRADEALAGIVWWNELSRFDRAYWLGVADSDIPVDAWHAYRAAHERAGAARVTVRST